MRLEDISRANRSRAQRWHPGFPEGEWTLADWSNALAGESGEACNIVKKIRRVEAGLKEMRGENDLNDLRAKLGSELADVYLYLDLLASVARIDLRYALIQKFNEVSKLQGFPERIDLDGYTVDGEEWHQTD